MNEKGLRTYMDFPAAVDPAHILTMADLDLSIALGSTLVTYNEAREPVAGLADRWEVVSPTAVKFYLRSGLKWSDGSSVLASQYQLSLARAKKLYGADLKALFDSVTSIETKDEQTIVFHLSPNVTAQSLVMKLTEPMYALLSVKPDGVLDLARSTGAYTIERQSPDELALKANPNWYSRSGSEPPTVTLRRPKAGVNAVEQFIADPWGNLVSGSSIQRQQTLNEFEKNHFSIWQRKLDKLFALYPTKGFIARGGDHFIKSLNRDKILNGLMNGLSGFTAADQFFPRGYAIWSPSNPTPAKAEFGSKDTIKIIVPGSYSYLPISETLPKILETGSAVKIKVEVVPMSEINGRMKKQDYDILATGLAVADPNFEGAVSFFVERDPPFIASGKDGQNFSERVKNGRSLKTIEERATAMRSVFFDAQMDGYVLPLFHFSSFAVAKTDVDLSTVPDSIETIIFSKVRMK